MKLMTCCYLSLFIIGIAQCLPNEKVLDLSHAPKLARSEASPRSVNLSFFIPAFSLFQLATQMMPQMFPSFTTTTTSRRQQKRQLRSVPSSSAAASETKEEPISWVEKFISDGLVY